MRQLIFALYSEGSTDERFLPGIIRRTTESLLPDYDIQVTNIELKEPSNKDKAKLEKLILQAAYKAFGSHVSLIHSDADRLDYHEAYKQRFQPGYKLVQEEAKQKPENKLCHHLVPVIPVRMTEAWMLADLDVLVEKIGRGKTARDLGLPLNVQELEEEANPKQTIKEAISIAYADETQRVRKSHKKDIKDYYSILSEQIRLEKLQQVPSYQRFVTELKATLKALNFIRE